MVMADNLKPEDLPPDIVNYNLIEENLYLGNLSAATDIRTLKKLHISHILTIDSKPLPSDILRIPGLQFFYIEINDMSNEDLLSYFPKIIEFISDGQLKGNVLVHCYFGVSRSACAVVAYLMRKYNLKVDEALERVKVRRRCVGPNSGFLSQLILFQNLNYNLTTSDPNYKLYTLSVAGEAFKRGKFSLDQFSNILKSEDGGKTIIKCRSCRIQLLDDQAIIPHHVARSPKWSCPVDSDSGRPECALGIFATPCQWMLQVIRKPQGKLHCPKCQQKLGSFNWIKGWRCPCEATICPGFFFIPSKVDINHAS